MLAPSGDWTLAKKERQEVPSQIKTLPVRPGSSFCDKPWATSKRGGISVAPDVRKEKYCTGNQKSEFLFRASWDTEDLYIYIDRDIPKQLNEGRA